MSYKNLGIFFEDIARKFSNCIAIHDEERNYTYKELDDKANFLANYIKDCDVIRNSIIGIISTKSFEDYALMIACLKCGVAYTNIDVDNPKDRTENILQKCRPQIVFSKTNFPALMNLCKKLNIKYTVYHKVITKKSAPLLDENINSDTLAYIMFTSGSTGTPKGASITHGNLFQFIDWAITEYQITSEDNFANVSPMYFDNSVFDFYTAFFSGASLTPIRKSLISQPLELVNYVDRRECTIWFSVPSMLIYLTTMKVLNKNNLNKIRVFTFGGEGYPKGELKKLYNLYKDQASFINVYGPTECTCICSCYKITDIDFNNMDELAPIGKINKSFAYAILEKNCDTGIGELGLLGDGVGKGYYNDSEITENAFISYNNKKNTSILYRTGDLVKEANGLLYFKGRKDNQIKHMGYRIELEEIEFALNNIDYIKQAAVVYQRQHAGYGKIIAFFLAENEQVDIGKLKEKLRAKLPLYMVPNTFKELSAFPKNANGKLDKKQLEKMVAY